MTDRQRKNGSIMDTLNVWADFQLASHAAGVKKHENVYWHFNSNSTVVAYTAHCLAHANAFNATVSAR